MQKLFRCAILLAVLASPAAGQASADTACAIRPPVASAPTNETALLATVPIEVSNNHVFVLVCHGSRALSFILDTGAPSSYFDLNTAKQNGVTLGTGFTTAGAGSRTVGGAQLERTTVNLAGSSITHPVAAAIDFSDIPRREGHRLNGLLGYDFIDRFVVRIDYVGGTLQLYDRKRFQYEGAGLVVPVSFSDNKPYTDAEVTLADGSRIGGKFLIDVGGSQALNFAKPWIEQNKLRARIGPTAAGQGGSGVGGATDYEVGRVASIRFGAVTVASPIAHLHGDSAGVFSRGPSAGTIGGDVLRRFTVVLDYPRKRLIFEQHAQTNEPFETDGSGLSLAMDAQLSTIIIQSVAAGSVASTVGLTKGDTIVAMNGEPTTLRTLDKLRALLRKPGESVELSVKRGDNTTKFVVVTRRVL